MDLEDPAPATTPVGSADSGSQDRRRGPATSTHGERALAIPGTLVATSCALVATAVAVTLLRPADPNPPPRRTLQRITYDEAALPRDAAWAPDGQWVVYANDRAGNADLWKQRLGDPDPVRLTTSDANESQPQWSPDGQSIVFRSERDGGGLYVIPASGGVERSRLQLRLRAALVTGRDAHSLQAFGGASRSAHHLRCGPRWQAAASRPAGRARCNSVPFMPPGILTPAHLHLGNDRQRRA